VLLEFQKIQTEKEHLEKVLIAHEFCRLSDAITNSSEKRERMQERIKHLTKMQKILEEELVEIKEQTERVTQERLKNGGSYFELEEQLKVLSKEIQKLNTQRQFKNTSIEELKQQQKDFEVQQAEVETTLEDKKTKTAQLEQKFEGTMKEYDENQQYVTDTENLLQTLTTGLTSTKGKENGYMDQLITNKKELSTTNDEINKLKIRLVHIEKELKTEEPKAKKAKKDNQALVQEIESNKNVLKMVSDELDCFTFDPFKEDIMVNDKIRLEKEVKDLKSKIDDIESNLNGLSFSYDDPCPNFDRKKVRGLVANLITIPNEHEDKANALEVCAGGKLKQIVVDTGEVVTQLLQNGRLPKRYTFIPLDKIKGYVVAANVF
jgi:structural maintenance of chromosome 2